MDDAGTVSVAGLWSVGSPEDGTLTVVDLATGAVGDAVPLGEDAEVVDLASAGDAVHALARGLGSDGRAAVVTVG